MNQDTKTHVESNLSHPRYLTEREVAQLLSCSLSRLRQDRHKSRGLPYSKMGRSVRYSVADVSAYMTKCRVTAIQ